MSILNGALRRRASSSITEQRAAAPPSIRRGLPFVCGFGIAAPVLDAVFRFPLHLPGRHGLTEMALFVMARCVGGQRWSATAAGAAAAITATLLSFFSPMHADAALLYLLAALVIDGGCVALPEWRDRVWFLALLGGFANATKPLVRWVAGGLASDHTNALSAGLAYPLVSHMAFGFAGALIAAQLWRIAQRRR